MNNKRILISKSGFGAGFTIFMIAAYLFQIGYLLNNSTYQLFIKVPFFVAVLYIFINIKRFKPNTTVVFLLLYSASMVVSVVLTSDITLNIIMLISMQLFCIMSISLISQKGVLGAAVKGLLLYFFLSCLINDVIWVMHGFHPLVEGNSRISLLPQFFIGNKFAVMYHHIFLLFLILTLYKGHHRKKIWTNNNYLFWTYYF